MKERSSPIGKYRPPFHVGSRRRTSGRVVGRVRRRPTDRFSPSTPRSVRRRAPPSRPRSPPCDDGDVAARPGHMDNVLLPHPAAAEQADYVGRVPHQEPSIARRPMPSAPAIESGRAGLESGGCSGSVGRRHNGARAPSRACTPGSRRPRLADGRAHQAVPRLLIRRCRRGEPTEADRP